jgi:hypothetical protein
MTSCLENVIGTRTFGELDSTGARSVLRRYCDAWFIAARRRRVGDARARYPRRRRGLVPLRWYAGTFTLDGRMLHIPVARGCAPLLVRLDRDVPYPAGQVRSVALGFDAGRLYLDVTAEVPVAVYPDGAGPDLARVAGVDLGIIHPYAVAGRRPPRPQARTARIAQVAAAPAPAAAGRGPALAAGPAGPARSRQDRRGLGSRTAGGDAGGRRPARGPHARRGPAA